MRGEVGDRIIVESERAGQAARTGMIEAVLSDEPPRYQIHWDDGRTSTLAPAAGAARIEKASVGTGRAQPTRSR